MAEGKLKKQRTLILALVKSGFSYKELMEMEENEYYSYANILFPPSQSGVNVKTYQIPRPT